MSDWPRSFSREQVVITPYSLQSLCLGLSGFVGAASAVFPSANLAIFYPFVVCEPFVVVKMFTYNGAAVGDNVDVGLFAQDGTRLVSMGSTAQSGTNALQSFDIADTQLGPGVYYAGLACSGTTSTFFRRTTGNAGLLQALGFAQQASAFALPATATLAAISNDYLPMFGLTGRTVL